jgi:hypothetical protein
MKRRQYERLLAYREVVKPGTRLDVSELNQTDFNLMCLRQIPKSLHRKVGFMLFDRDEVRVYRLVELGPAQLLCTSEMVDKPYRYWSRIIERGVVDPTLIAYLNLMV